jgi:DNA-3-methyladenine glycosylase
LRFVEPGTDADGVALSYSEQVPLYPLPRSFFSRDPRRVARDLLGKLLIRNRGKKVLVGRIVEVEAYLGKDDPAAHAAAGVTARNRVLFGPPGHAYVYFIYGNHFCLNVSCQPKGKAGCVLIRALEPLAGLEEMALARGLPKATLAHFAGSLAAKRKLTTGPGRLSQAMGITRARDNGKDLTSGRSDLWLADEGFRPHRVRRTPRVGIKKAVREKLRYTIAGSECVSR